MGEVALVDPSIKALDRPHKCSFTLGEIADENYGNFVRAGKNEKTNVAQAESYGRHFVAKF